MLARKEEWRDLPGYEGWYQVSDWGRICSFRDPHHKGQRLKTPIMLNPTITPKAAYIVIKWQGKQRTVQVGKAVATTFIGAVPKGWVAYHKDGDHRNNALKNIAIAPRKDVSQKSMREKVAGWNRKPVLKIDRGLTVVEAYPSSSAAARANGYRQDAMWRFCTLAVAFSVFAPDDFLYTFDDDAWVRKAISRAKSELDAMNARYNDPFTECYYDLPTEAEPEIIPELEWMDLTPALAGGGRFGAFPMKFYNERRWPPWSIRASASCLKWAAGRH